MLRASCPADSWLQPLSKSPPATVGCAPTVRAQKGSYFGARKSRVRAIDIDPGAQVLPEKVAERRLSLRWQQVEVRIGGGDRIRLVHNQLPPKIEASERTRKREGKEQPHKSENGALDGAESGGRLVFLGGQMARPNPSPDLQRKQ